LSENVQNFQNEINEIEGRVPLNQTKARFKISFSFPNESVLILYDGNAVEINAERYPTLNAYFSVGRFYRLSILYELDERFKEEMVVIEKLSSKE